MKPRGGAVPEPGGTRAARSATGELASDEETQPSEDVDLPAFNEDTDGRPEPLIGPMETAEIDISRDRRVTMVSPIPAQLAEAMLARGGPKRDPAAPTMATALPPRRMGEGDEHHTRRVGDSDRQSLGSGPRPNAAGEAGIALCRQRAAALIDGARRALDEGDLTAAVTAAEAALQESDEAPPPGIVEVIEPARALLARVFAAYVGPLGGVPVLAPRADEIARARLGERERSLVARIDGQHTLEALFDGSGLGSTDALRIAARLIRAGAIRVI